MSDTTTLLLVTAAMVVLPVVAVWWSCRVAPPVKPRVVTLRGLMRILAESWEDLREAFHRIEQTGQATADDIRRFGEAYRRDQ